MNKTRISPLADFALLFKNATEKGGLLILACFAALFLANFGYYESYHGFTHLSFQISNFEVSVHHFVNDFLMVLFFLMVGLEIKREMIEGHLATKAQRILPVLGAIGGVVGPIIIYSIFNWGDKEAMQGWAIPAATDIAFALGMFALVGKSLPVSLRVFLAALAIIDDLIAVLIIAFFYSDNLELSYLGYIVALGLVLFITNNKKVSNLSLYLILGLLLWYLFIKSGIHATVAGVMLGMFIPNKSENSNYSPLKILEHKLAPICAYFILPIFAFVNSGVKIVGSGTELIFAPVTLGIALGLFLGKQLGIFSVVFLLVKSKLAALPKQSTYLDFYGVSILCGIGFTMSLFVGNLAFAEIPMYLDETKIGVLLGSLLSVLYGLIVIYTSTKYRAKRK